MIDWPETRLRLQLWLHRAWPFRVLAWLRSRGVPESKGFDKFGDKPCRPVPTLTPQQVALHGGIAESKAFSLENAAKLYARTKPISDKETEKIVLEKYESMEFADFEPITTAQYEVLAQAAPLKCGRLIDSLLPDDAEELQRVKAQRVKRVVGGITWTGWLALVTSVVAAVVLWRQKTTDKNDKSQARRDLAAVHLRDSCYERLSWRSRADAAVDAVYLYALATLGRQADGYEHPDAKALKDAAEKLGLSAVQIAPAVTYLKRRCDPARPLDCSRSTYDELISIAEKLRVQGKQRGD